MRVAVCMMAVVLATGGILAETAEEKALLEKIKDATVDFGNFNDGYHARYIAQRPEAELDAMRDLYLSTLERLVALDPKKSAYRLRFGNALLYQGRHEEALRQYEAALAAGGTDPELADAYWGVANALFALGRRDDAVARLEECLARKLVVPVPRGKVDVLGDARIALATLKDPDGLDVCRFPFFTDAKAFPEPQKPEYDETFHPLGKVRLVLKGLAADDLRVKLLKLKYARLGVTFVDDAAAYPVTLSVDAAFASDPALKDAVNRAEAYRLTVDGKGATVTASGPQGVLWGVVSLVQVTDPKRRAVRQCRFLDWPSVARRGYLTGGGTGLWPGCTEYTVFQKMNCVTFQSNPTFGNNFRPLNEYVMAQYARQFKSLGLEIYYGCCWITHADQLPICKPRTLPYRVEVFKRYAKYGAGIYYPLDDIRFPMLPEDLKTYGSAAAIDSKHITEIFREVRKEYPDFKMIFCPPFYCGPDGRCGTVDEPREPYLKAIARDLDPAIDVYWTGPRVKSYGFTQDKLDWFAGLIGRKPFYAQNALLWHNLLYYPCDELDIRRAGAPGYLDKGTVGYHVNSTMPRDCPRNANVADALWNLDAYDSARSALRGTQQIMGERSYEILKPGADALATFDRWRYGVVKDGDIADYDLAGLEARLAAVEKSWTEIQAYAKENGTPIYTYYGGAVEFPRKVVRAARNPPDLNKFYAAQVNAARTSAMRETHFDRVKTSVFLSPADLKGGHVICPKRILRELTGTGTPFKSVVTGSFACEPQAAKGKSTLFVSFVGKPCPVRLTLNGAKVFEGKPKASEKGEPNRWEIPVGKLKSRNTLTLERLEPGKEDAPPVISVAYVVLKPPESASAMPGPQDDSDGISLE